MEGINITPNYHSLWVQFPRGYSIDRAIFKNQYNLEQKNYLITLQIIKYADKQNQGEIRYNFNFRYFYKLLPKFYQHKRIGNQNQNQLFQYIKQCINTDKFNFNSAPNIFLNGENYFTLICGYKFNLLPTFNLAIAAASITKSKRTNFKQTLQVIEKYPYNQPDLDLFPSSMQQEVAKVRESTVAYFKKMLDFDAESSYRLDCQIFDQGRFKEGTLNSKDEFVFFLTSTTSQIFQIINDKIQQGRRRIKLYFYGQGGIGKSTTLCLLVILHNLIDNIRTDIRQVQFNKYPSSVRWKDLQTYPKFFYFSFQQNKTANRQRFWKNLRRQLPYELQVQQIPDYLLLQKINEYYTQKKVTCIYVIDQINIYYSLLRRDSRNQSQNTIDTAIMGQVYKITRLLLQLQEYNVIYGSSENIQTFLSRSGSQGFSLKKNCHAVKIHYEKMLNVPYALDVISFENVNQIIKRKRQDRNFLKDKSIQQLIQKNKELFRKLKEQLEDNTLMYQQFQTYLSQLTHQRIKQCFKKQPELATFFIDQKERFPQLIIQLHEYMIEQQSQKYKNFLQKGTQQLKHRKHNQLMQIRAAASNCKEQKGRSFSYKFNKEINKMMQESQLYKEHAQINNDQLIIYYSPKTFLKITDFVEKKASLMEQWTQQILQICQFNGKWAGYTLNKILSQLLSNNSLYFDSQTHASIYNLKQSLKFHPFTNILIQQKQLLQKSHPALNEGEDLQQIMVDLINQGNKQQIIQQTSIYCRFYELFNKIMNIKDQYYLKRLLYLCAVPTIPNSEVQSIENQVIDFLLIEEIKNQEQSISMGTSDMTEDKWAKTAKSKYNLRTYNISAVSTHVNILEKVREANLFFRKFTRVAYLQNQFEGRQRVNQLLKEQGINESMNRPYQFTSIIHTFLLPKKCIKDHHLKKKNHQQFSIEFFPLEHLMIYPKGSDDWITSPSYCLFSTIINYFKQNEFKYLGKETQ